MRFRRVLTMVWDGVRFLYFLGPLEISGREHVGLNIRGGPKGLKTRKGRFKRIWRAQIYKNAKRSV